MYKCVHVDMFYTFPAGIQNGFMLRMYNKLFHLSDGIVVIMWIYILNYLQQKIPVYVGL